MRPIKFAAAWLICAAALLLVGCAPGINGMRQTIANTATIIASGYKALGQVDAQAQARVRVTAQTDARQAGMLLAEHLKRYDITSKALDGATVVVEAANASLPLVERGVAGSKDAGAWIADLVAAGVKVAAALKEAGAL